MHIITYYYTAAAIAAANADATANTATAADCRGKPQQTSIVKRSVGSGMTKPILHSAKLLKSAWNYCKFQNIKPDATWMTHANLVEEPP